MVRSARVRVILVGLDSPHPNFFIMERGIRLILSPKSHRAAPTLTFPMVKGIVKAPGSFNLGWSFLWRMALKFSEREIFSSSFGLLLLVNKSFHEFNINWHLNQELH